MTEAKTEPGQRLYFWVGVGAPGAVPQRLEITECPGCAALLPVTHADLHQRWHRQRGD